MSDHNANPERDDRVDPPFHLFRRAGPVKQGLVRQNFDILTMTGNCKQSLVFKLYSLLFALCFDLL